MINKSKHLTEMIKGRQIPIRPFMFIDAYNRSTKDGICGTIKTTIDKSNMSFITILEDGKSI